MALVFARGARVGFVGHVRALIDVKAVRSKMGLSQAKFANQFGFSVDAVRNWEQGRRQPDVAARAFLMVIDREPEAVRRALSAPAAKTRPKGKAEGTPQQTART